MAMKGAFFVLKNQLTGLSSEEGPSKPGPWTQTSQSGVGCWGRGLEEAPLKLGDLAGELTLQPKVVEMGVGCQD